MPGTNETSAEEQAKKRSMERDEESKLISNPNTDAEMPSPPSSSPSETGSLMMEDPEDEDADPDWLVDAT